MPVKLHSYTRLGIFNYIQFCRSKKLTFNLKLNYIQLMSIDKKIKYGKLIKSVRFCTQHVHTVHTYVQYTLYDMKSSRCHYHTIPQH